jgi:hypothetical protein
VSMRRHLGCPPSPPAAWTTAPATPHETATTSMARLPTLPTSPDDDDLIFFVPRGTTVDGHASHDERQLFIQISLKNKNAVVGAVVSVGCVMKAER